MGNWKTVKLSELGTIVGGATPTTSREEYYNGDIPWLTPKDLAGYSFRYISHGERNITKAGLESCSAKMLPKGTVLFSSRAPIGYVAIAQNDICTNQGFKSIVPNEDVNPLFLYYLLKYNKERIEAVGSGTTFKEVSGTTMRNIEVCVPAELEVQNKIAHILDAIDSKIENNNLMNDNLEKQTKVLFKEWFIDNPDVTTWQEGTFSNLIEKTISGDWGKDTPSGNHTERVYCIRGADIPEVRVGNKGKMPTRYILPKNFAAKQLVNGDIVVEVSGGSPTQSTGRAAAISSSLLARYDKGMVCTNFCKALKPIAGYSMYVYHYWQYLYDLGIFFLYENGTTGIKNLDIGGFIETEPISIAPVELVNKFDSFCQSVFSKIYANGSESEQLALIRDALLPKLMSNNIDVSEYNFRS